VLDEGGRRVEDAEVLRRVRALAIPPAWRSVWICRHPSGHIQATGVDAAGRRQYLYHEAWRAERDREKFDRMLRFARVLPRLRERVEKDLAGSEVDRPRVLACATRLLDRGFFRIGGDEYAEDNGSFGLTTLLKTHVQVSRDGVLHFDFVSKGGQRRRQRMVEPEAAGVIARVKRRRHGTELLAYRRNGGWSDVRPSDVNDYIKEAAGDAYTAKDFRTWHATVLAAVAISVHGRAATSRSARASAVTRAVSEVARFLGNTPAVCRGSYVDPRVFERFDEGRTIAAAIEDLEPFDAVESQQRIERAVLRLLTRR
jgi:DNA topoisomerase IB